MVEDARVIALATYLEATARFAEHERRKGYCARASLMRHFARTLRALVEMPSEMSPEEAARHAMLTTVRRE